MAKKKTSIPVVKNAVTRVIAYARVSTEQQSADGHSLKAQEEQLRAFAVAKGYEVVAFESDEGLSASSLNRPALQRALERLERFEAEALLVVKLDRLTRSVRDLGTLIDSYFKDGSISLIAVHEMIDTSTAGGRMLLNILTAVSQWEREASSERTAAVMAHMKAEGMFTGGFPPFGFYVGDDGVLVEHAAETRMIERVQHMRGLGMSLRGIASNIGLNPRTGKPFAAVQIARML